MATDNKHSSSFRDPSGYLFTEDNILKRKILPTYFSQFNDLTKNGIYSTLIKNGLLIPHEIVSRSEDDIIIKPEKVNFISYPYEWSFDQYKDAALLTLKLQLYCLKNGFTLKDASAYNVTFHRGKAIFIDTLSFDYFKDGDPWKAYSQFISHFLGPLALAHYHGDSILKIMASYIDGIPVGQLASLLPFKSKLNLVLYSNIHLYSKFERKYNTDNNKGVRKNLSKNGLIKIVKSLYSYIQKLKTFESSEWEDYYSKINYSDSSFKIKGEIIKDWISQIGPKSIFDAGGNDGTFIKFLNLKDTEHLLCDIDYNAINQAYKSIKQSGHTNVHLSVQDLCSPSPGIGFNNSERFSFFKRLEKFNPQITLALALIHHISISRNVDFKMAATMFASFSEYLIIEFPTRKDSWVKRLLETKLDFKDKFNYYNQENFEKCFSAHFKIIERKKILGTDRILYLFKKQ